MHRDGLPIVGDDDARCVFFFAVGEAGRVVPISLPIRGTWNGMYPKLDAGWHETALLGGLRRLDARPPRPTDPLFGIVDSTVTGAAAVVTESARSIPRIAGFPPSVSVTVAGEPITFCAALEAFYDAVVSSGGGLGEPAAGSLLELACEAIGRMIKAVPMTVLPGGANVEANELRWRKAIEHVGTADVTALVEALHRLPAGRAS